MFIKICGITTEEDALLAVAMGADALGFIFAPSPRQVQPTRVREILRRLPADVMTVGVFRDELPSRVIDVVQQTGLKAAQLHGHELPNDVDAVRKSIPFVIKAFSTDTPLLAHADEYTTDAVLIDGRVPGSGQVFDWNQVSAFDPHDRLIVAGGLTPENVGHAISVMRPWGVDVATGVESSPGHKDASKVRAFIANARSAAQEQLDPAPENSREYEPYNWQDDGL